MVFALIVLSICLPRFYNSTNGHLGCGHTEINRRYNMLENVMGYSSVLFGIIFIFF